MRSRQFHRPPRRASALLLTAALLAACVPVSAAEPIGDGVTPTYDEAYYATLDYYGNLTEGSVVKSYTLNGAAALTDHGTYDQVVNLTDGTVPTVSDGVTTFDFGESAPKHFYFEGKTQAPFDALPWTLSMHYTLNGVPAKAEDLAGAAGVVEITADAIPNEHASEYAKNNYTLEAMALFNQDDILSLEAPGAQVQLIGNLRAVLFLALPGEEQHFTIRVGTDDFAFDGMTFLMVPATLSQLEEISKLSERKDDLEENYDKLSSSLDTLLNSISDMSGSLYAAASGLEQLNTARGTLSGGKGQVYADLDTALGDLSGIAEALKSLESHLDTASQALTDINKDVDALCGKAVSLQSELDDLRDVLDDLDEDLEDLQSGQGSLGDLRNDLKNLGSSLSGLKTILNGMQGKLNALQSQADRLDGGDQVTSVDGQSLAALSAGVRQLKTAYTQYCEAVMAAGAPQPSTDDFEAYLRTNGQEQEADLWAMACSGELEEQMEVIDQVNGFLGQTGLTVDQMKALIGGLSDNTSPLLSQLSKLCAALGDDGLSGSLSALLRNAGDGLDHIRDLGTTADDLAEKAVESLKLLETLNATVNDYIPEAQQALADSKALAASAAAGTQDLHTFLTDLEMLMKQSGGQLDAGAKQTLAGLAAVLRSTARSVSTTGDVKSAKNSINTIIEDTWNDYTGDVNNLLNMDAAAEAVSLTSAENPAPTSIQVLIRSQEIKPETPDETEAVQTAADNGTFWSRVAQMFKDFWAAVTGLFR